MRTIKTYELTRYEIAAVNMKTGARVLVSYAARHSRAGLVDAVRARGQYLVALTGCDTFTVAGKRAADGIAIGDWVVKFTGRTQRDVRNAGDELPYVGAMSA